MPRSNGPCFPWGISVLPHSPSNFPRAANRSRIPVPRLRARDPSKGHCGETCRMRLGHAGRIGASPSGQDCEGECSISKRQSLQMTWIIAAAIIVGGGLLGLIVSAIVVMRYGRSHPKRKGLSEFGLFLFLFSVGAALWNVLANAHYFKLPGHQRSDA
jgi:hypothetical protein